MIHPAHARAPSAVARPGEGEGGCSGTDSPPAQDPGADPVPLRVVGECEFAEQSGPAGVADLVVDRADLDPAAVDPVGVEGGRLTVVNGWRRAESDLVAEVDPARDRERGPGGLVHVSQRPPHQLALSTQDTGRVIPVAASLVMEVAGSLLRAHRGTGHRGQAA
uniref:hypothetical protein n=1 Tax=Amycolatopsis sp. CA-293810 TaxID=3239926 RepID=UPI003F4974AB